jgi:hypothetical protein
MLVLICGIFPFLSCADDKQDRSILVRVPSTGSGVTPFLLDSKGNIIECLQDDVSKQKDESRALLPRQEYIYNPEEVRRSEYLLLAQGGFSYAPSYIGLFRVPDMKWGRDGKVEINVSQQSLPVSVEFSDGVCLPYAIVSRAIPVCVIRRTGVAGFPYVISWFFLERDATIKSGRVFAGEIEYPPDEGMLCMGGEKALLRFACEITQAKSEIQDSPGLQKFSKELFIARFVSRKATDGSLCAEHIVFALAPTGKHKHKRVKP